MGVAVAQSDRAEGIHAQHFIVRAGVTGEIVEGDADPTPRHEAPTFVAREVRAQRGAEHDARLRRDVKLRVAFLAVAKGLSHAAARDGKSAARFPADPGVVVEAVANDRSQASMATEQV